MTYIINHGWMDISIKRDAKKMNAHEHEKYMENDTKNPSYRKKEKIIIFSNNVMNHLLMCIFFELLQPINNVHDKKTPYY